MSSEIDDFNSDTDINVNRRTDPRTEVTGSVQIDSTTYSLENWSLSGILFSGHNGQLVAGQRCLLRIIVNSSLANVDFMAKVLIVRIKGDMVGARFLALGGKGRAQITKYFAAKNMSAQY